MTQKDFQQKLIDLGQPIKADGNIGEKTKKAFLAIMENGPDTKLTAAGVKIAADLLNTNVAKIWAVWDVEASGDPFINGRPTILFEPHIFSRLTNRRFDNSHPHLSSKVWNRKLYPSSQLNRYNQLADAIALDPDAGLSSASYGGFQILGMNYAVCGFNNPWDFVYAQSRDEQSQLIAFVNFVKGNRLDGHLRNGDWAKFARGYNGTGYRENQYDTKLAAAYIKRST